MIDLSRDELITEQAMKLFKDFYMTQEETSPQESLARAAKAYSGDDEALAERIYRTGS